MQRRILFLDIDGVLNSDLWYQSEASKKLEAPYHHFDPRNIQTLNKLLKNIKAELVISSTWRNKYALEELTQILQSVGLEMDIIGTTPDLRKQNKYTLRGNEILKWCMDNEPLLGCCWKDYYNYAILDDNTDFLLWQADNFFKTDRYSGLTATIKKEIERFFKRMEF